MKRNLKVYFFILLTLFSSSILIKAENQEIKTLISFKESSISSDPKNFLSNWSLNSSSPCSFAGITCSNDRHVTTLNLSGASLSGTLRLDKITILPFLTHVDFTGNFFSGNLSGESPTECSLESLNLSYNNFSKPISINISCNNFLSLNLSNNRVPGGALNLSPSLSSLDLSGNRILNASLFSLFITKNQNLNFLNLSHNKMRGDFEFIANISQNIKVLDLSHNNFTQNLTSFQFSSCRNLSVLYLSDNALFSSVSPSFFTSCPLLEVLDLGNNTLEFAISGNMLGNLKNLRKLNLARNRLFGEIPFEFGENCAKIQELDLSGNNLTGGLPLSFSNSSIISLNVGYNRLSGDFLGIFDSLFGLRYLNMSFNNLTGELPLSLSSNSRIVELDLSSNGFIGKIPSGFCSLSPFPVLEKLLLANNYFSGTIPSELGKCKNLVQIDFSFNELGGEIPIEIWNLPKISDLAMWANNITGELPEGICTNGGNLQTLILNNNLISGNIPHSIANCTNLVWVSLSSNLLTGTIPIGIGNLINLAILQLGDNSLSGQIPREIGGCRSLIWLDLNSNKFNGNIPFELSENAGFVKPGPVSGKHYAFVRNEGGTACRGAGGLVEFDGIRAKRLENFPMVHSCPWTRIFTGTTVYMFSSNGSMIYLDLSYNMLSGTIPQNMGSMAYLQVLNLGHNKLTGNIPFEFGGLRYIGVLDLSYNKLQGMIPGSLGRLTFLNDLDVSNNHLFGAIPSGGQLYTFSPSRYENNTGLCGVPLPPCRPKDGPPHSATSNKNKTRKEILTAEMIIGLGVCLLCITALMLALYRLKRKHNKMRKGDKYIDSLPTSGTNSWKLSGVAEPLSINVATFENPLRKLTFAHLLKATNGFSSESLIGAGGFGEVYKAQLKDGSIVAIKKLINATSQGEREFVAEMETIGKIRHQNLVPLLGYCKVGEERLLVYDYMKWGSLESVLHENNESKLNWPSRKKIAIGSARGLAFLHHSCIPHIIHRDMKSSNILLDENFDARVSDFGMARLVSALDTHLSVSTLAGTPGYVPPEYYQSFRCTAKGDVYSYGVILLELLSGKRPIDPSEFGEDNNLVGWAKQLHTEKRTNEILDPVLASKESIVAELYQCLEIAFVCVDDRSFRRPTMMQVLSMFKDLHTDLEGDILDDVALKSTVVEERQDKETVLKARATFSINVENV